MLVNPAPLGMSIIRNGFTFDPIIPPPGNGVVLPPEDRDFILDLVSKGARSCPPGTSCQGLSVDVPFVGSMCLGLCKPIGGVDSLAECPPGMNQIIGPTGETRCVAPDVAIPQQQNGKPCPTCCKGFHLNKSGYFTKAGFVPPESKCVRNRRKNFANGPAAKRATRRLSGTLNLLHGVEKELRRISPCVSRRRK